MAFDDCVIVAKDFMTELTFNVFGVLDVHGGVEEVREKAEKYKKARR